MIQEENVIRLLENLGVKETGSPDIAGPAEMQDITGETDKDAL